MKIKAVPGLKLDIFCRWLLALVFLTAGLPKLFDVNGFAELIGAYGIVPDPLVFSSALVIAAAEVIGGLGLLFKNKASLYLISVLMFIFIAVLSYGIVTGLDIDCGCFSANDPEHKAFSGLRTALLRDLLLLVPLLYLFWPKTHSRKSF